MAARMPVTLPRMLGSRAPFRHPPFGRLFTSYTVNQLGDSAALVALAVLVYAKTGDPLATTALFLAAQFLPALLAPALTAGIDQRSLRRTLPLIYLGEAAVFAALALVSESFSLALVLVLVLIDGALMLTARALTRAALNNVLEPLGLLREGNGWVNLGFAGAGIAGAAAGGLLVEAFGVSTALFLDAGTFLLVAILIAGGRALPGAASERETFGSRMREGLRYARRVPRVRALLAGEAVAILLFTVIVPIEVVYAAETLDASEGGYGALLAAWGTGALLGSMLYLRSARRSLTVLILCSTAAIGFGYLGMGLVRELWAACALSIIGGAGNGVQWVSVMTAVQEATPADFQARIAGLLESIASAVTGLGFVLGGVIVAVASPPAAFLAAGGGILLLTLVAAVRRPAFEGATPPQPQAAPSGGA